MTMDYKKEEIKCGEISALLSAENQKFFLNCVFCEYTFLQLEKFIHHMCEDHFPKINNQNAKNIDHQALTTTKEIDVSDDKMELQDEDENDCYLNGFERVEIELDSEDISNEVDKDAAIPEEYGDGFSDDNYFEESVDTDYSSNTPNDSVIYRNEQVNELKNLFQTSKMTDIFSSYAKHPALWDKRIRQPTKKEKENLLKDIASTVGMPEEWKNIQKLVAKFRFKLHTEIIRMQIYEAKGREYTPAWLTDLKSFIKQKPRLQKQAQKKPVEIRKTISNPPLLTDDQYIALAKLYKKFPCLWDENDITYRFNNRRSDALECIHNDFNLDTGLSMTQKDIESEIAKLRKICSDEKKQKLRCKRNKIAYKSPYSYYDHIAFIEVNVSPYECSICGEILSSLGQYKIHLSTHNGSLPYKCHICGHEFKIAANLTVHLRRHVHDYTYNCEICSKSCATSTDLKIHMRSHTGEKPYFCDICGKSLRTSSLFSTHMRRHENRPRYNCEYCDKPFYTKGLLTEHMNAHMKVKDKICNVCNKGFTTRKQLRQHKYIHDKEKRFVCKICTKRFAQHAGLSGHMKSHGTSLANLNKSLID
ncbi:zinc finger protein 566-like isoform X1 [Bactrocera neohumeralis]|uniref:zinc finger protein 566-like isoform X1 n=1 Tax=Bactrocera tryoni TaxID=59916 RepID=UPI001A99FAA0|nr:zinc finger protein 566-like isoform X1 [Bactrocera tryoni]XP_050330169.1 zinc finger protein 566-like isoform X1 [Bactrocera neohumeralis]